MDKRIGKRNCNQVFMLGLRILKLLERVAEW